MQTLATLLGPTCCERLHTMLCVVATCGMKFETGQTSEPTSANISIVSRSSKRGPTMLRRRTRTTCYVSIVISIIPFYSCPKTQHVVTCCKRLHTSANIAQQETTMLAQQCCVLLRAFARALKKQHILHLESEHKLLQPYMRF